MAWRVVLSGVDWHRQRGHDVASKLEILEAVIWRFLLLFSPRCESRRKAGNIA